VTGSPGLSVTRPSLSVKGESRRDRSGSVSLFLSLEQHGIRSWITLKGEGEGELERTLHFLSVE
jgi:hypothetical protein